MASVLTGVSGVRRAAPSAAPVPGLGSAAGGGALAGIALGAAVLVVASLLRPGYLGTAALCAAVAVATSGVGLRILIRGR